MKWNFVKHLLLLVILCASCKPIPYKNIKISTFYGNDLDFLGSYKTAGEKVNNLYINYYDGLNLKTIRNDSKYEFWIGDSLIYSADSIGIKQCRVIEVFKKNFVLISNSSCAIATPDYVDRHDVKVIDLNSKNTYKFSLNDLRLTRSIEMSKIAYSNSNKYYGILNFDLDSKKVIIYNKFSGSLEIDLTEFTNNS